MVDHSSRETGFWGSGRREYGGEENGSLRDLRKALGMRVWHSDSSHLVDRQCGACDSKDGLDVCCRESLGYLTHRGVVLGKGEGQGEHYRSPTTRKGPSARENPGTRVLPATGALEAWQVREG